MLMCFCPFPSVWWMFFGLRQAPLNTSEWSMLQSALWKPYVCWILLRAAPLLMTVPTWYQWMNLWCSFRSKKHVFCKAPALSGHSHSSLIQKHPGHLSMNSGLTKLSSFVLWPRHQKFMKSGLSIKSPLAALQMWFRGQQSSTPGFSSVVGAAGKERSRAGSCLKAGVTNYICQRARTFLDTLGASHPNKMQ